MRRDVKDAGFDVNDFTIPSQLGNRAVELACSKPHFHWDIGPTGGSQELPKDKTRFSKSVRIKVLGLGVYQKLETIMMTLTQTSTPLLPHQADVGFLLDGGCETTLIFHDHVDLPHFASFTLLETSEGTALLRRYFERYLHIAQSQKLGFILESPTWRASSDWGALLG